MPIYAKNANLFGCSTVITLFSWYTGICPQTLAMPFLKNSSNCLSLYKEKSTTVLLQLAQCLPCSFAVMLFQSSVQGLVKDISICCLFFMGQGYLGNLVLE